MKDVWFHEPVILEIAGVGIRQVASSYEALECLELQWPQGARGRRWRAASRACRDALDGWRTASEARKSFVKAAKRHGLMAPEPSLRRHFPAVSWSASASLFAHQT